MTQIRKENEALTAEIRDFVQTKQNAGQSLKNGNNPAEGPAGQLEVLLERLYVRICEFGLYQGRASTPEKSIIAAWESFLGPTSALTAVEPHGHMIAARMTLYLTQAYLQNGQLLQLLPMSISSARPIALRCNFAISLDDLLLSCLTRIWSQSENRELFNWVFTSYPIMACRCDSGRTCQEYVGPGNSVSEFHRQRRRDQIKTACITDPAALTPENGIRPRWRRTRQDGGTAQYQDLDSDGPIRESYHYGLVDEDTREIVFRDRAALRRSRQFILDARRIAECNLARDSERVAQMAMARRSLPAELQLMVLEYVDGIQEHPYVGQLDLSAVYRPFPDISKKCSLCTGRASSSAERTARATCPVKSVTVWSLPLRVFHTFHGTSGGNWQLCRHTDCAGHHRDSSWKSQNVTIQDHLNSIIQKRCGQGVTLEQIGLGPLSPARLPTAAQDRERERRLFSDHRKDADEQDIQNEARWGAYPGSLV